MNQFIWFFMIITLIAQPDAMSSTHLLHVKSDNSPKYNDSGLSVQPYHRTIQSHRRYPVTKKPSIKLACKLPTNKTALKTSWQAALKQTSDPILCNRYQQRLNALSLKNSDQQLQALHIVLNSELITTDHRRTNFFKKNPNSWRIQELYNIIGTILDQATRTIDIEEAFNVSDLAHELCQSFVLICNVAKKAGSAVAKGTWKAATTVASIDHWKEFANSFVTMTQLAFNAEIQLQELDSALTCPDTNYRDQVFARLKSQGIAFQKQITTSLQQTTEQLKNMSWEELLESGTELGATLLFDTILLHGATWGSNKAGQKLIQEINTIIKSSPETAQLYCREVTGIAKAVIKTETMQIEVESLIETVVAKQEPNVGKQIAQQAKNCGKKKNKKPYIIEYVKPEPERKLFPEIYDIDTYKHMFSDDHKAKGILKLGNSEEKIAKKIETIVQTLYEEGKLAIGDNQIQTTMEGLPIEIRFHFLKNAEVGRLNLFIKDSGKRCLGNRIIL